MELKIDSTRFGELIPNVIHEVRSETPLFDKMQPWIASAKTWVEDNFLGDSFDVPEEIYPVVEKIIVYKAFAEAVPSLDVVLTPAGFAVISTEGRAPASKERIERLIASLNASVDSGAEILLSRLIELPSWTASLKGRYWLSTFITNLGDVSLFRGKTSLLYTYRSMRSIALRFEQEVAESYIGKSTLEFLRFEQSKTSPVSEIVTMIRNAELRYIANRIHGETAKCPDEHEVWHLIRPVVNSFVLHPDLYVMWETEMRDKFKIEPFKNDIQGGFYF